MRPITISAQEQQEQIIFVKKDRENQHDQSILNKLKQQRKQRFARDLQLIKDNANKDSNQMIQQLQKRRRQCLPFQSIVQNKITYLKHIHIEYELQLIKQSQPMQKQYRYSVDAFDFFKLIHENKSLASVTLKGVQIQRFRQFLTQMKEVRQKNSYQFQSLTNESAWMKEFSPPKHIKLSVNTNSILKINSSQQSLGYLNDFVFFIDLFQQLSDMAVQLHLGRWANIYQWGEILQKILKYIRKIKKIRIKLIAKEYQNYIKQQSALSVRSILFGQLSSFESIASLSFQHINFDFSVCINDYLAIEQSLSILFGNNQVTHLQLYRCESFPIFPLISTLTSINLYRVLFRQECNLIELITKSNPSLKSIQCENQLLKWTLRDKLFAQLQTLVFSCCLGITLDKIQLPSRLKHLSIYSSNIGDMQYLSVMFPKLFHLSYFQIICTISSPFLETLILQGNDLLTNKGLKEIDKKWPLLKYLTLLQCYKLTKTVWSACEFKGLIQWLQMKRMKNLCQKQREKELKSAMIDTEQFQDIFVIQQNQLREFHLSFICSKSCGKHKNIHRSIQIDYCEEFPALIFQTN